MKDFFKDVGTAILILFILGPIFVLGAVIWAAYLISCVDVYILGSPFTFVSPTGLFHPLVVFGFLGLIITAIVLYKKRAAK